MSALRDRVRVGECHNGSVSIGVSVGRGYAVGNAGGTALAEIAIDGAPHAGGSLWLGSRALKSLALLLRRAGEEIEARTRATAGAQPTPEPTAELLGEVASGARRVTFRKAITRDGRAAIVLAIHDDARGMLGELTLTAGPANKLEQLVRRVVPDIVRAATAEAPPPVATTPAAVAAAVDVAPPVGDEVLVAPREEPRPAAELAPEPVKSRYAAPPPPPRRRVGP